jgi:hypothetical protein
MGDPARSSPRARAGLLVLVLGFAGLELVAGAPLSPLVPRLPAGVAAPSWSSGGASALAIDRLGRTALTVVSVALLGLLVVAFALVVREAARGRVGLRLILAATAVSLALAASGPLLLSRDVHSYAAYGRMLALHGANPYRLPPSAVPGDPFTPVVSREWVGARSVYGPAFTLLSAGIARVWSGSPSATILAFKILAALAAGLAALFAAMAARVVRPGVEAAAAAMVGLNPVIVVHTVGGGHNDAIVAALLAGALLLAVRVGPSRAGVAVTALLVVASLVKVIASIPLLLWLWLVMTTGPKGRRSRTALAHGGTALGILAALTIPVFAGTATLTAVANLASRQGWASPARLVARGAQAVGRTVAGSGGASVLAGLVYGLFAAMFIVVVVRLILEASPGSGTRAWGIAILVFALAAPYLLPWYAAWFAPFLALIADRRLQWAGLAACGVLALTGVPAEPATDPALWRGMQLAVHYVAAPLMLLLLAVAVRATLRPSGAPRGRDRAPIQPRATPRPSG